MAPTTSRDFRLGRFNQIYAQLNLICNANSCDWIELDSAPDLALLKRAIEHTIDRHPRARSVQYQRGVILGWRHLAQRLPIEIEQRSSINVDPARLRAELLGNAWNERVPTRGGHPFRFIYTRTPEKHILQFLTSHTFTDGKAAQLFSGDIAEAYGRLSAGLPLDPEVIDLPEHNHDRLFLAKLRGAEALRLAWKGVAGFFHDLVMPAGRLLISGKRSGETDVLMIELPAPMLEALKAAGARRGSTIHPLLLLALLRTAQADAGRQGKRLKHGLRIVDNFSLRRFVDDPRVHKLYDCVAVPYTLELDPNEDDEAVIQRANARLDALKNGEILSELYRFRLLFQSSLLLPKAATIRFAANVLTRANLICTNVGPIDTRLEHFGPIPVRTYYSFPQLFPPGEVMVQVSAFRGHLRLVYLYDKGQMNEAQMRERFVYPLIAELSRITGASSLPEHIAAHG
ncbi:hypothetical protein [Lysobacter antibioticus]|uniref:hypothetical protein n=1 Tax=Lysobacter antibioticus TaxID=84531 RepID=UPI0004CFFF8B|nr:hypothetical protein [Lysobacter antibioticus]